MDIIEEKFNEAEREYNKLHLKWTASSIRYLIGKGFEGLSKTFNTLRIIDPCNTIALIECSVQDKNKANEIFDDWHNAGYGDTLLQLFIIDALRNQGFFMTEDEMNLISHLSLKNTNMNQLAVQALTEELSLGIQEAQRIAAL